MVQHWADWPAQRFLYLFVGLAYLLIWVQVGLLHWRGAFRHKAMWGPVIEAPFLALMGIVFAFVHGGAINVVFIVLYAFGTFAGLAGTFLHLRGIQQHVGGFTLRNFIAGPPVVLPIVFMTLSVVQLLVYFVWPVGA